MNDENFLPGFSIAWILPVIVVGFFAVAWWSAQSRAKENRRMNLAFLAEAMGWTFRPHPDETFAAGWGFLQRLNQGTDRYAFNIIEGESLGHKVFVFDYQFQIRSRNRSTRYNWTFVMLIVPEVFPRLSVRPETLQSRVASALGFEDIQFESAEFSRTFCVRSEDKKFAYDVCNPQMIEFLLSDRKLDFEIQGPALMLVSAKQLPAETIAKRLQQLFQMRSLLPGYLLSKP